MICRSRFRAHNLCDKVQRATCHSWPASTPPSACTAPHLPSFFTAPISVRFHLKCKQLLKPPCRANNDAFKCAITISTTQTRKNCRHQLNYICIHIYTVYTDISVCPLAGETSCSHTNAASSALRERFTESTRWRQRQWQHQLQHLWQASRTRHSSYTAPVSQ